MRTRRELEQVLGLAERGLGASTIARATGIPRGTIRDWLAGRTPSARISVARPEVGRPPVPPVPYARLLGLYLGDGHIVRMPRTYMLRIFFDAQYPGLIGDAVRATRLVAPAQRIAVFRKKPTNCVILRCHWNAWPLLFPQHGPGRKHERVIELEPWQRAITHAHPEPFIAGLINSDGCRIINPVRHGDRLYTYPRYFFTNMSEDIKRLFCEHLDLLGIAWRRVGRKHISIARREAVAALDEFVGPKR